MIPLFLALVLATIVRAEICDNVPVIGDSRVVCGVHGKCVRNVTVASLSFSASASVPDKVPYGSTSQSAQVWDDVSYCKCHMGYTGVDCNQPCPGGGGEKTSCSLSHIEGRMTDSLGCGQVFHALPPCPTCRTREHEHDHRQKWMKEASTWAMPGMCACGYPNFGFDCSFTFDRRQTANIPTFADFLSKSDGKGHVMLQPAGASSSTSLAPLFPSVTPTVTPTVTTSQIVLYPNPLAAKPPVSFSVCGSRGKLMATECRCDLGVASTEARVSQVTTTNALETTPSALESRLRWKWSQMPQCTVPLDPMMPWLKTGQRVSQSPGIATTFPAEDEFEVDRFPVVTDPSRLPPFAPPPHPVTTMPISIPIQEISERPTITTTPLHTSENQPSRGHKIRYIDADELERWNRGENKEKNKNNDNDTDYKTGFIVLVILAAIFFGCCLCAIGRRHWQKQQSSDYSHRSSSSSSSSSSPRHHHHHSEHRYERVRSSED